MKRFALPDTLPTPYFTIDAAGGDITVKIAARDSGGQVVEVWRDGTILCRVFAATVKLV